MFYDLDKHERRYSLPAGSYEAISYELLAKLISAACDVKHGDRITHFHIRDDALHFRVETAAAQRRAL